MKCPSCEEILVMTERQGVEIDYCPKCRGVWLDKGELDKIIEKSAAAESNQQLKQSDEKRKQRQMMMTTMMMTIMRVVFLIGEEGITITPIEKRVDF